MTSYGKSTFDLWIQIESERLSLDQLDELVGTRCDRELSLADSEGCRWRVGICEQPIRYVNEVVRDLLLSEPARRVQANRAALGDEDVLVVFGVYMYSMLGFVFTTESMALLKGFGAPVNLKFYTCEEEE